MSDTIRIFHLKIIILLLLSVVIVLIVMGSSYATNQPVKYKIEKSNIGSKYPCTEVKKKCLSKGIRKIDGFDVNRDCWEYTYEASCKYPSKDDCRLYDHCYPTGKEKCLLKDRIGNCVNMEREFACEAWNPVTMKEKIARLDFKEKRGAEDIVCTGIPCIEGNCVDKSYITDGSIMNALTKLQAIVKMKPDSKRNFNLFSGHKNHCSKKMTSFTNCCRVDGGGGWGSMFGAKCTKDEQTLAKLRGKKLCVHIGNTSTKKLGVTTVKKQHYCCFGNMLDKVIQVEGRKQLGKNFGSPDSPKCGGLDIRDIEKIDFDRVDFSEFIEEFRRDFANSYESPKQDELIETVKRSMPGINRYDQKKNDEDNNRAGWDMDKPEEVQR